MKIACLILASGNSLRFHKSKQKLFYKVYGKSIIEYTLGNLTKYFNKEHIYITISKKLTKKNLILLQKYTSNQLILGGSNRFESVKKSIPYIKNKGFEYMMIHDAARPLTPSKMIIELLKEIKSKKYDCVIPKNCVEDTLRKNKLTVDRKQFSTYQTPQAFKLNMYLKNLKKIKNKPTDDFGVIEKINNLNVKFINGSKENIKITFFEDISLFIKLIANKVLFGNGFDIHKLTKGNFLSLGGLKIKSNYKSIGHSDGDVVLHSLIDAILGALRAGDIGEHFPSIRKYKNRLYNYLSGCKARKTQKEYKKTFI